MQDFASKAPALGGALNQQLNCFKSRKLVRIMKITAVILLGACLQLSARGLSQSITLSMKDATLKAVFKSIEKQTEYAFFFDEDLLKQAKKVTINVNNLPLPQVLDLCFKEQPFSYSISGRTITLVRKKEKQEAINFLHRSNATPPVDVKGRVINESGEPVQASITIKGTTSGTTTNRNGEFQLNNVEEQAILIISGVGIEEREIKIGGVSNLNIVVKISVKPLEETIIKGYYTTVNKFNTGTVSTVTSKDIQKQPINNPLLALEGMVPGVAISQNSGVPGAGINIQIRGQNSLRSGGNEPLYIVDGVPYNSLLLPNLGNSILQQTNGNFNAGAGNSMSFINPNDIESISILKDADATAIYGSRGANGVVLITTKRGTTGNAKVNVHISEGMGKVGHKVDLLNTQQYLNMRINAFANDGETPNSSNAPDLFIWDTTSNTNWQKLLFGETAKYTNAQANITGGEKNIQYLIGGTLYRETTVFPGDFSDKKATIHFNLNTNSNNGRFKTNLTASYLVGNRVLPQSDFTLMAYLLAPNAPNVHNQDGSLNWANSTWPAENPFVKAERLYETKTSNIISNLNLNYNLCKGFDISTSLGYNKIQINEHSTIPITSLDPGIYSTLTGSASFVNNTIESYIIEPKLSYQFAKGNSQLEALVGSTFQMNKSNGSVVNATGFTSDALLNNIQAASNTSISSVTDIKYKYNGGFARIGYTYSNKYILNFTARRDGSSRFGENNRFHNFGSIAGAWLFSDESFLKQIFRFLSFGKLKASYGSTGSDQIGDYKFYDLYSTNQYTYQGSSNLSPQTLHNPNLQWEETKKSELGIELGFIKSKILFNANYYSNRSSNQLVSYALPTLSGFANVSTNFPATIRNQGYEFYVNTTNVKTKSISWSTTINLTIPKNKLLAFSEIENTPYKSSLLVGQPLTIKRVYHVLGVNDTTGAYQFSDSKGAPTYNPNPATDNISTVNTAPKFYGGVSNTFRYGGLQLDFLFQFVKQIGNKFIYQKSQPFGNFYSGNQSVDVSNNWKSPGDHSNIQAFTQSFSSVPYNSWQYISSSDYAFTDASFIRLKNVSLSYLFANSLIKKAKLKECKVYLQGQNLLVFTKYKGPDPETTNGFVLPPLRMVTIGASVTF